MPKTISSRWSRCWRALGAAWANAPWLATDAAANLRREAYSPLLGVEENVTNRALRSVALLSPMDRISPEALWRVKMDTGYAPNSGEQRYIARVLRLDTRQTPELARAQRLLRTWDGTLDGRGAADALAFLVIRYPFRNLYRNLAPPSPAEALADAVERLSSTFDRLDPPLGELVRLRHGPHDLPLTGGPGALRAIYTDWDQDGRLAANLGDSYIMNVSWDRGGRVRATSVHQFGAATSRPQSRHYADQAPLFARGAMKPAWFSEAELASNIACSYRPGERRAC